MQYEDRIIHFSVELIHQPVPYKKDALQKLYYDLSQTRGAAYDSSDFTNPVQARFYSRRGPKTQSMAVFLPDRVVLIEEWADTALSSFVERSEEIAGRLFEARGVPVFLAHTVTIRATFALTHFDDARVFLLDHACGQAAKVAPHFRRPVAVGGLRFVLPETEEHAGNLHVTIESFRYSRNEVFVEVKGIFGRVQVSPENLSLIPANIRAVREFISDNIHPYLNQYDQRQGAPDEA